jgi:hypothetical protein
MRLTPREAGLLRARTMTPEFRKAMVRKGNVVKAALAGLGKSDRKPSPSPWAFPHKVRISGTR